VVCYINSAASVKAVSDICCTSSSALRIVRALPQRQIIFVPDQNLGAYVANQIPEKEIILFPGFCPIHNDVTVEDVLSARRAHPHAQMLMHPECRPEVLAYADYIGSTSGIIETALASTARTFIIATEKEIADGLRKLAPEKEFFTITNRFLCPDMKKTRLKDIIESLETQKHEINMAPEEITAAAQSLERMVGVR